MAELNDWNVAAASNNSAPPNGAPEGMAYSAVNDVMRENMAVLKRWLADNNGSLASAGTAPAYTLTPNGTYSAYFVGMTFAFRVHSANNAGASTLNVSSLGARNILTKGGSALIAGMLPAGAVARVVYDGTQFQLIGVEEPNQSLTSLTLNSTTDVTLGSTAHAFQIGAASAANLAASEGIIQARNNGAEESLSINPLGGTVVIGEQAANSDVVLLANLFTLVEGGGITAMLMRNRADGAPAITAAQAITMRMSSSGGLTLADIGYINSLNFAIKSKTHGGHVQVTAEDAGGTEQTVLELDPDNGTTLWRPLLELNAQNGNYTLVLADGGKMVLSDGSAANQITVPPNSTTAFPVGTQIWIANDGSSSTNDTTVVQGAGVTVSGSSLTVANKRSAKLIKVDTDSWMIHHG